MFNLKEYVLSIIAVAIIVGVFERFTEKTHLSKAIKMVGGMILSVVLLAPLGNIGVDTISSYFESINLDAKNVAEYGEGLYNDNLKAIISERCESYILDKAHQLGAIINVSVHCDSTDIPLPVSVEISGSVSPYIRNALRHIIAEDIGIPKEMQLWV